MSRKPRLLDADSHDGGVLYMLATPIGNLGDISERMRATLSSCDVIAAEDTRVARKLLQAIGLQGKKVVSVREHNERSASQALGRNHKGKAIAYLSDAGTPSVSDPGAVVAAALREMGFTVVPIPGPSAVAAAMSASGFKCEGFVFAGFLPRRKKDFVARLRECASLRMPVVVYESPARVRSALSWIAEALGEDTTVCMCRELTKMHESVTVDIPSRLVELLGDGEKRPKGEFTLVVEAISGPSLPSTQAMEILRELTRDLPASKASRIVAKLTGESARDLYRLAARKSPDGDS